MQKWYAAQPTQRVVIGVLELPRAAQPLQLEAALRTLCARHAYALGVCEQRASTRLRMRPLTAADALPWAAPGPVWQLAGELCHSHFGPGAPLFQVALDDARRHLLLALDHLVADGVSTALLCSELARLLEGVALPALGLAAELALDARLELRPRLVDLAGALRSRREAFVTAPETAAQAPRATPLATAAATAVQGAQPPRRTQLATLQLEASAVEALRSRAHTHGLSLHALLTATGMLAALGALDRQSGRLRVSTPISLRARCQPQPDGVGVYIASAEGDFQLARDSDAWQLARHYHDDLQRQRPDAHHKLGLLALAGDLAALARSREDKHQGRTATLEVSNVGRVDLPAGYALWLTQGAHYHAPLFVLTVAESNSDGRLRLCVSYPEPLIDAARAERFRAALAERLARLQR